MAIRRSSDRGFVPYSGCNRVCGEMMLIMQTAEWYGRCQGDGVCAKQRVHHIAGGNPAE